jgi:hypothetical protein
MPIRLLRPRPAQWRNKDHPVRIIGIISAIGGTAPTLAADCKGVGVKRSGGSANNKCKNMMRKAPSASCTITGQPRAMLQQPPTWMFMGTPGLMPGACGPGDLRARMEIKLAVHVKRLIGLLLLASPCLAFASGGAVGRLNAKAPPTCISLGATTGLLNLKSFGASGSIQTMTCTAGANSNVLRSCSGGDFRVGTTIRLPSIGTAPTESAPSPPALVCSAFKGASCAGKTVYTYEFAGMQGVPNGAITAVSAPVSITQATQTAKTSDGNSGGYVGTTLTFPSIPTGHSMVVYKGVNGGPLTYYTVVPQTGTSFVDDGNTYAPRSFSCGDFNLPCAPPSAPVPNDAFAIITAVNGSDYTIGPLPHRPQYLFTNNFSRLPSNYFASAPAVSGRVTVYHDDTPAFQAVEAYLWNKPNPGNATIFIPSGDYNVFDADQFSGGNRVFGLVGMNNVTIEGAGWCSKIHQIGSRDGAEWGSFISMQAGDGAPTGIHSNLRGLKSGTAYNLVDPELMGATSVTLSTPVNARNFSKGEYVTIAAAAIKYPGTQYWELNKVTSVDPVGGVIGLESPLAKPYSARLPLPYSQCVTCNFAPVIYPMPYGPVATNIRLKDFWYEGAAFFVRDNVVDRLTEDNLYVHASNADFSGTMFHKTTTNSTFIVEGTGWVGTGANGGSTGSAHTIFAHNHLTYLGGASEQNCQEGSTDIVWEGNDIHDSNDLYANFNLYNFVNCYGFVFNDNTITVANSSLFGVFAFSSPVMGTISGNAIRIDNIRATSLGVVGPVVANSVSRTDYRLLDVSGNSWEIDNDNGGKPYTKCYGTWPPESQHAPGWNCY